jgi:hypothetical protein
MFDKNICTYPWIPYFQDLYLLTDFYSGIKINKINLLIMRIKLLAFILIIIYSCSRKSTNETNNADSVIVIDLLSEPESTVKKLSEIATNVEYIALQTSKSSFIAPLVLKIVSVDNRIYIRNSGLGGEILCFDINGKFLFKIQNIGRGPEEYASITDFDISSDNKILTILSSIDRKLLVYGISETGFTFQRSITLRDPAPWKVSMVPETDNAFLAIPPWRGTEPTLSLLINTVGDTIHFKPNCYKYENVRKTGSRALNEMLVYSIGKMVCFMEEFSDTVFYVDAKDNYFKPRMIFDTHGTLFTPEMRGNPEIPYDRTSFIVDIFETSRYVFYSYGTKETRNSDPPIINVFFDKRTKKKYKLDVEFILETILDNPVRIPKNKLRDDLSGGPDFNIRIDLWSLYCSGGKFFSFVEALTLKQYVNSGDFKNAKASDPKKKEELKKLADSLKEADNPVLIIVTPKD